MGFFGIALFKTRILPKEVSCCRTVRLVRIFRRSMKPKVNLSSFELNLGGIFSFLVLPHPFESSFVAASGIPILGILGLRHYSKIFAAVVKRISVDVIYLAFVSLFQTHNQAVHTDATYANLVNFWSFGSGVHACTGRIALDVPTKLRKPWVVFPIYFGNESFTQTYFAVRWI